MPSDGDDDEEPVVVSVMELRCEGRVVDRDAGTDRRCGQREGHGGECTRVRFRRRRTRPRSKTIAAKKLTKDVLRAFDSFEYVDELAMARPLTRGDCVYGGMNCERPCPWVACKHHLYLDILETGSIKINFPDLEPWQLQHSCALDVADRGGVTLEETGAVLNLTRERVRQLEVRGLLKLRFSGALKGAA